MLGSFLIFNETDGVYASPEVFTKEQAELFISEFPKAYELQGYYKTGSGEKIPANEVVLLLVPFAEEEKVSGDFVDETGRPWAEILEEDEPRKVSCRGRGCENNTVTCNDIEERFDAYGIHTGYYCAACYENNYPYRKDRYFDPGFAGESMEEDY